jgi:hypothetical protein
MDKIGIPKAKKNKCEEVWRDYSEELVNRNPAHLTKVTATDVGGTGEQTDTSFYMLDMKIAFNKN